MGYNVYVGNNGELIEERGRLIYGDQTGNSGIDILLSAILSDQYIPYPRRVEVAGSVDGVENTDSSVRTQFILNKAYTSMTVDSTTRAYSKDKNSNKLLSDYLENPRYNQLVFVYKDAFGYEGDTWVYYPLSQPIENLTN